METLAISSGKVTMGTPGPKGRYSISYESVVSYQITPQSTSLPSQWHSSYFFLGGRQ